MNPSIISSSPPSSSHYYQKTNTVAVTSLPKSYFDPLILDVLRNHFATYGEINQWVPLPGFSRIIIVYTLDEQAELAKQHCDTITLEATTDRYDDDGLNPGSTLTFFLFRPEVTLRVFRADPNPLATSTSSVPEANYLRPPAIEKNFLISPPGSPPVGWEPRQEDPPNATPLADDLMAALRKLQIKDHRSSKELLLDPHDGSGVGVYVEDFDGDNDQDDEIAEEAWTYGVTAPARSKWAPIPTAMPPMRSAIVA